MTNDSEFCEKCGTQLKKIGYKESNFHAVFSDHKLKVQRYLCLNCNNRYIRSVKSMFGTSIYPDLSKLQCEMGSAFSFFKSECQLANWCQTKIEINNHERIKRIVNNIGEELCAINIENTAPLKEK